MLIANNADVIYCPIRRQ